MAIEQFVVKGLGHQFYVITDVASGTVAVVDPRRDIDSYLEAAEHANVTITHVFETHVHNDYLTGGRELVEHTGANIVTAADAKVAYPHHGVHGGDRVPVGTHTFEVLATPGHIPGAQHLHIGDLMYHLNELPRDRPIVTICRSGYRAAVAASIVAALGHDDALGATGWRAGLDRSQSAGRNCGCAHNIRGAGRGIRPSLTDHPLHPTEETFE